VAVEIVLSDEERSELERIVRSTRSEQRMVTRARVVLAAADGRSNRQIAGEVGIEPLDIAVPRHREGRHARVHADTQRPRLPHALPCLIVVPSLLPDIMQEADERRDERDRDKCDDADFGQAGMAAPSPDPSPTAVGEGSSPTASGPSSPLPHGG